MLPTLRLTILCAVACVGGVGSLAAAEPIFAGAPAGPDYLLLRAPQAPSHGKHASDHYYPGRGYGVSTNAYAYGWFGAAPRRHWSRHHGYYRNYTQWSKR